MIRLAPIVASTAALLIVLVASQNPPCEICGCSFCEPGQFPLGNQTGIITIPPELGDESGLTQIPCSLLDFAAASGQIPPDICNDELRTLPEFREICGCPPLPPRPPTNAPVPSDQPSDVPSDTPSDVPSDTPSYAPSDAPSDAPSV